MTTTSTMQGLGSDERPTSRVLRPPGGGSSDIFGSAGGYTTPSNPNRGRNQRGSSNIFGAEEPAQSAITKPPPAELIAGAEEYKLYGKGRNQSRGRFNPITGEPYDENGSPSAATPEARQPQQQKQEETASPIVGAAAQSGQGDSVQNKEPASGKARPDVHTSSRVINPPGGKSSGLW